MAVVDKTLAEVAVVVRAAMAHREQIIPATQANTRAAVAYRDKAIQVATDITAAALVILTQDQVKAVVQITLVVVVVAQDQKVSADGPTELMQQAAKELPAQLPDQV